MNNNELLFSISISLNEKESRLKTIFFKHKFDYPSRQTDFFLWVKDEVETGRYFKEYLDAIEYQEVIKTLSFIQALIYVKSLIETQ